MKLSEDVRELAGEMARRHGGGETACPYILFVGHACAREAGVPSIAEMAKLFMENFFFKLATNFLSTLKDFKLEEENSDDDEDLVRLFNKHLGMLSSVQRSITLQSFYRRIPVPVFYQDMAVLIKTGFFKTILTTNIDTLLEQAMNMAGMRREVDYTVVNLGEASESEARPDSEADADGQERGEGPPVTIIKLLGDIGQTDLNLDPDKIEEALKSKGYMVKRELSGDIIMAGYEFECEPVDRWLTRAQGTQLWWVNPEATEHESWPPIAERRRVSRVEGSNANYEEFFALLNLLLLRLPVLASLNTSVDDYVNAQVAARSYPEIVAAAPRLSDGELEVECVRDQLRRCRDMLYKLEQLSVAGEQAISLWLQSQLDYQRRKSGELENSLRRLTARTARVVELMAEIIDSARARHPEADGSTVSFLQSQLKTVKDEFDKQEPNHHIVSAAIGATITLAERLGSEVVKADTVRELALMASGAAAKGV